MGFWGIVSENSVLDKFGTVDYVYRVAKPSLGNFGSSLELVATYVPGRCEVGGFPSIMSKNRQKFVFLEYINGHHDSSSRFRSKEVLLLSRMTRRLIGMLGPNERCA